MSHHHSPSDTLVRMANDIGKFFAVQGEARSVPGIADHIAKFWEARMKRQIFAHLDQGGAGLEPYPLKAIQLLRKTGGSASVQIAPEGSVADAAVKTEPISDPAKSEAAQDAAPSADPGPAKKRKVPAKPKAPKPSGGRKSGKIAP